MADERDTMRRADDGVRYRGVLAAAGVVLAAIAIALGSAFALLHVAGGKRPQVTAPLPGMAQGPASGPALQPDPVRDIAAYRAEKERQLTTYGWVDREHGIVRIPITRAMDLVAPSRPPAITP